ncbi:MAG TPA: FAD/NAD(P)-binding protein [Verrucomicrobiae bacterium]|nr:FAD/NAD(P)-binding protein [Verrucomicrobiae bacterium]
MRNATVVIAGGGASGTILAAAIARYAPRAAVVVVEPRERLGPGLAYSTACPDHLLNVPAARMSALADAPEHFVDWLSRRGEPYGAASFVPRALYGEYLACVGAGLRHVRARVCDASLEERGLRICLDTGESLDGDALVLALGNAAPARWPGVPALAAHRFFASAWEAGALESAGDEHVLLLGTGLTAVDAVLGLRFNGHRGPISMLSRRGLLPHEHRVFDAPPGGGSDWRTRVDAVRPQSNAIWQRMPLAEKRRFLRHLMPYWTIHRHRMAPEVARAIAAEIAAGTLRMLAGRTGELAATARSLRVPLRVRGSGERITIQASRAINCSGPEHDVRRLGNPLIDRLLQRGLMVPHPLGVGIETRDDGALCVSGGVAAPLYAIGPVRFGTLIETTAIPEIRAQANDLARKLSAAACGADSLAG